jgi:hypothetical protein
MIAVFAALSFSSDDSLCSRKNKNCSDNAGPFARDDLIKVTAHIELENKSDMWSEHWAKWYVTVDKLTILSISPSEYQISNATDLNITLYVGPPDTPYVNGTSLHPYIDGPLSAEFLSALIFMEEGKVTAIRWDPNFKSSNCNTGKRDWNIHDACHRDPTKPDVPRLQVFLGFVGTDSHSVPFVSAQTMPSTFITFGVGDAVNEAESFVGEAIDWFK